MFLTFVRVVSANSAGAPFDGVEPGSHFWTEHSIYGVVRNHDLFDRTNVFLSYPVGSPQSLAHLSSVDPATAQELLQTGWGKMTPEAADILMAIVEAASEKV